MSESESLGLYSSDDNITIPASEYPVADLARGPAEREGLPQSYRMRADAHYVDQLEAPVAPVIRLLATGQIECPDLPGAASVEPLTQSLRVHGMLQPLLIRRHNGHYRLIAGRKRLAAAIAAGITSVPCVLHDIDASAIGSLAEAENLRVQGAPRASSCDDRCNTVVLQALEADLSTIRTSLSVLKSRSSGALAQRVSGDLVEAQVGHAEWILSCLTGAGVHGRSVALAAIFQRVVDAFEVHTTLTGVQIECNIAPGAGTWRLPEAAAVTAIKGAVFSTLTMLEGVNAPRIELHADASARGPLKIEVVQRAVPVAPRLGDVAAEGTRPAEALIALALETARSVAGAQGGSASLNPLPGVGSVFQMTFSGGAPLLTRPLHHR